MFYTALAMHLYSQLENQVNNLVLSSLLRLVTNKHGTDEARKKFLMHFSYSSSH